MEIEADKPKEEKKERSQQIIGLILFALTPFVFLCASCGSSNDMPNDQPGKTANAVLTPQEARQKEERLVDEIGSIYDEYDRKVESNLDELKKAALKEGLDQFAAAQNVEKITLMCLVYRKVSTS